ncbi:hypothetical protein [Merismopedia glauca]|uniref:Uncharacterized protein n=2 Tax=Merismopedia TaxID=53402 RepID=A0A2T1C6E8_9CYAN|nr:hypothetical protein [Merismopedia glauca]PSB03713.1 hypothetical protein C7B64_07325 [Merismopedia glauca CCAP 1448/3]
MLQNAIVRMANNSLEVKKVGLTVWAAIVGFGFTNQNANLFVLAFVAFVLFGILDVYYLYLERRFRDNFNRLSRIINGYETSKDNEWIEKSQGNFLKMDASTIFLAELPHILQSWANLPYLIVFVMKIALVIAPLPLK